MRLRSCFAAAILALACMSCATPPQSRAEFADCPIAYAPYSTDTVLLDLLINPRTSEVLERHIPSLAQLRQGFLSATPPTLTAVMTVHRLSRFGATNIDMEALDRELSAIPVTQEDAATRCARYDYERPEMPANISRPAILVFDKSVGFKDEPSVNAAAAMLDAIAEENGWTLVTSSYAGVFNQRDLAQFDAIVWNNVSGDVLTLSQRAALRAYVEGGGGFAALHGSGGDRVYLWDWYADTLLGARFVGHPSAPDQYQEGRVTVEDGNPDITAGLPRNWTMTEEWYSFRTSPRDTGAQILLTLDEASYQPTDELRMGDHPIAWSRCIDDGRSFYTAIGHIPENYAEPNTRRLMAQGIAWAMGGGETTCRDGVLTARRTCPCAPREVRAKRQPKAMPSKKHAHASSACRFCAM